MQGCLPCLQTQICFRVSFLSAEKKEKRKRQSEIRPYSQARVVMNKEMIKMET